MNKSVVRAALASFVLALSVSGCANGPVDLGKLLANPVSNSDKSSHHSNLPNGPKQINVDVDLIRMSHAVADALVAELRKNHPSFHQRKPILVTTFVNRNDLDSSSELGILISDHVGSRFTQQGYRVVEPRLRNDLAIRKERGEFILSRDISKLSADNKAYAVVVGNYTQTKSVLDFTARLVQIKDRQVLSSVDAKIPLGADIRDLLLATGGGISMTVVNQ
jgi:TolB-like protein